MIPRGARRVKLPRNMSGEIKVIFKERAIGIKVEQVSSAVVVIKSFHDISPGVPSPAALTCEVGDALLSINSESVEFLTYKTLLQKIRASGRPLELKFTKWQNEEEMNRHPGDPSSNTQEPDLENPIQQAIQMAARKRTKVYTGKNFGNHIALRKQERRCAGFVFCVLLFFMYFLYSRTADSDSSMLRKQRSSNIIVDGRIGNITKVNGEYVTIKINSGDGKAGMNRLKHHFHPLKDENAGK
jgi:hypothetical protein